MKCKHSSNGELRRANLDSAALPLHLSRGLSPCTCMLRRANLDSAASPLHLGRGLSPYTDNKKRLVESKLSPDIFIIVARLIAITKAPAFLCIIGSRFL